MAVVFCDVVSSTEVRDRLGDTRADTWFADLLRRLGDVTWKGQMGRSSDRR